MKLSRLSFISFLTAPFIILNNKVFGQSQKRVIVVDDGDNKPTQQQEKKQNKNEPFKFTLFIGMLASIQDKANDVQKSIIDGKAGLKLNRLEGTADELCKTLCDGVRALEKFLKEHQEKDNNNKPTETHPPNNKVN